MGRLWIVLPHTVKGGLVAANVVLTAQRPFTMVPISADDKSHISVGAAPETIQKGENRVFVMFPGTPVLTAGFADISPRAHFCIGGLQIGSVLEHTVGTICQQTDVVRQRQIHCGLRRAVAEPGVPHRLLTARGSGSLRCQHLAPTSGR